MDFSFAKFRLALVVLRDGSGLHGRFRYRKGEMQEETVRQMARHWESLLENLVAQPRMPLSWVQVMDDRERKKILAFRKWPQAEYPRNGTIHAGLQARARAMPHAIALVDGGRHLSYGALNRAADGLAHRLVQSGMRAAEPVGVCFLPSLEMILGFLAVLKAGGAYVPMDPAYPRERLATMIADVKMTLLLHDPSLEPFPQPVVSVALSSRSLPDPESEQNQVRGNLEHPRVPAVVIFSSGSTGKPKASVVDHGNLMRMIHDRDVHGLVPGMRTAQTANPSFDAASFEIWPPLLHGCKLHILPKETLLNSGDLGRFISRQHLDWIHFTTAVFNQHGHGDPDCFAGLRTIFFGGEQVDAGAVAKVRASRCSAHLVNLYGPSECTTFSTWNRLETTPADGEAISWVGPPAT